MFAMEMTSFNIWDWLIWLSYSFQTSCFIDLTSSSFAVPNKKWNSPLKGSRDLFGPTIFGPMDVVDQVEGFHLGRIISHKTESMSSIVIFIRKEYHGSLLWNGSEYLVKIALL